MDWLAHNTYINRVLSRVFIFTILCTCHVIYSSDYEQHTIIVKCKPASETFKSLRKIVPTFWSGSLTREDLTSINSKIDRFFTDYGIVSVKAVKPDADEKPLAGGVERIFIIQLKDTNSCAVISSLLKTKEFDYAEHDYFIVLDDKEYKSELTHSKFISYPNDPHFNEQWGLLNTGQNIEGQYGIPGADINILPAWQITTGNAETIVAILDSGIPHNNPDFEERIVPGYDFVNNDNDPLDDDGHGTAIAGIIAATGNNGYMISGINWKCCILPLKIFDNKGLSQSSNWLRSFVYASDHGAKVINISSSSSADINHVMQDAVNYSYSKGSIIITCMGNYNSEIAQYPAAYSNVISVGALNNINKRASFSNFGRAIDFIAPGQGIYSIYYLIPNLIDAWSGTSMSTAYVSGLVSLMVGLKNDLTFQDVYGLLKKSAKDQIGDPSEDTPGWDKYYGWGCIDAGKTITALMDTTITHPVPNEYYLKQNYPNPFNLSTIIEYGLTADQYVNLDIYDVTGSKVITLVNVFQKAGKYIAYWDAYWWASNIYFCVLRTCGKTYSKKMILIK